MIRTLDPLSCAMQVDIDRIRADNDKLLDAERKNGLVINSGREWHGAAVHATLCAGACWWSRAWSEDSPVPYLALAAAAAEARLLAAP